MPYINDEGRAALDPQTYANDAGELTYQIQSAIEYYLDIKGLCFQTISDITGALRQAQRDFDERIVEPYEKRKREENGDVWEPWSEYLL